MARISVLGMFNPKHFKIESFPPSLFENWEIFSKQIFDEHAVMYQERAVHEALLLNMLRAVL